MRPFATALLVPLLAATLAHGASPQSPKGNATRGRTLFMQNCAVCHATGQDGAPVGGQGPVVAGVVGRKAATIGRFGYTPALRSSGLVWDAATLDAFLAAPTSVVPGTSMVLATPRPRDRADLIAFLATLKPVEAAAGGTPQHTATSGDWENDGPGVRHHITAASLPAPYVTRSASNSPGTVERPADAKLAVPAGFEVKLFLSGLSGPRLMRTAPNGDIFVAETRRNRIRVLRAADGADSPSENSVFADGLSGPFGIAFYPEDDPRWVYVANVNSVVRFPYRSGDLRARVRPETVIRTLSETSGGHTTRDLGFSRDGRRLFVSVGSGSNVAEDLPRKSPTEIRAWEAAHGRGATWGDETNRAAVLVSAPDGRGLKTYATGIRNAVGLAVHPQTGEVWVSTNERDGLGDDLVPDYITHVREGGYYGWPWHYIGAQEDPRHPGARPDLAGEAIIPDVLVHAHSASLQMTFYPIEVSGPSAFPAEYRGNAFAALHGSWNRAGRTGSKVIRVRIKDGKAAGDYEDFLTGFVIDDERVWGRPVGVTVARDGALLVSEDANGTLWRVSHPAR